MVKKTKRTSQADEGLAMHTTFRIPRDLHQRLTAEAGDRGIGDEIRRRLERSFEAERSEATSALTKTLVEVGSLIEQFFGDWRKDAFAFQAQRAAINWVLERSKPEGHSKPTFNPASLADVLFSATDTPENVGKQIGALALHQMAEKEKAQ